MEEGVEVVLAKASELRLKINNCINKTTTTTTTIINNNNNNNSESNVEEKENPNTVSINNNGDFNEEAKRLLHIRDTLESLEQQLSNLQVLQKQQRYEREVALFEIEQSRKMLLAKLKEYKGEELGVIQEASAFAGEAMEHSDDLMLPPYTLRPLLSMIVGNHFASHISRSARHGVVSSEGKNNSNEPGHNQVGHVSKNKWFVGHFIGVAAKTVITAVGILSILSFSGYGPDLRKRNIPLKISGLFQRPPTLETKRNMQCPPGKILVMEDGEARCVVKERVAVPFEFVSPKPDVNYGCG